MSDINTFNYNGIVAPFAGAWIEIIMGAVKNGTLTVAPFAGAWIEIVKRMLENNQEYVAPFAGAWIEITTVFEDTPYNKRRSLRGSVD